MTIASCLEMGGLAIRPSPPTNTNNTDTISFLEVVAFAMLAAIALVRH